MCNGEVREEREGKGRKRERERKGYKQQTIIVFREVSFPITTTKVP